METLGGPCHMNSIFTISFRSCFNPSWGQMLTGIGGHRHQPSCRQYPTSNIDISYSDIGTKYVGLNPHIPISEEFQYRHQLPFRYRTKSISDIPISKIDKSIPNDPSKSIVDVYFPLVSNSQSLWQDFGVLPLCYKGLQHCGISDKSLFRYPI
jgi:hypothetical protein